MSFSEREAKLERLIEDLSGTEGASLAEPLPPDFARYKPRARLGEGATAVVYRAWDVELGREVALKVLRPGASRERFRREAQAAAGLAHPNVLTVHDAGEENGQLFLVMELVEGTPFAPSADRPIEDRLAQLEKAARGVGAAHRKGIVHRDLKPANILVTAAGEPRVADFGLARLLEGASELTKTGGALGTPMYMAPEQVEGREVSPRTDVFAFGVLLYEILAGRRPFEGQTLADLYARIVRDDPIPPRGPADLVKICLQALEKNPERRYADAEAFAEDLRRRRDGEPVLARPLPPALRALRAAWRRPGLRATSVGVLAALAVWAALGLRRGREADLPGGDPKVHPRLEQVRGEVTVQGDGRTVLARDGLTLAPARTLRTLGDASSARVTFPDGGRVDVRSAGEIRGLAEGRPRVERGEVETTRDLETPHGEIGILRGAATVEVDARGTRVEVVAGRARLTRRIDGAAADVGEGRYAATHGGAELAVRSSACDEIVLSPRQGVVVGGDWSPAEEGDAWEVGRRSRAEEWGPMIDAGRSGYVEFTFYARAGRSYAVWARGEAPARDVLHDAIFLRFAESDFESRPKRIWAFLNVEGGVINGFYRREGFWWIGGDADADGDLPPMRVRFRRTGLQTLRVHPFETPIRLDAIWLSTTQSERPAPDQLGPR